MATAAPTESAVERSSARGLALHFAVVLGVAGSAAWLLGGVRTAGSVAIGVTLAALNLLVMQRLTRALANPQGASALWAIALPFKLIALVLGAFALVRAGAAAPVPLAIGFAVLPLTGVFLPSASSVARRGVRLWSAPK